MESAVTDARATTTSDHLSVDAQAAAAVVGAINSNSSCSRVVHVRNIPSDATDTDLFNLALPFGKVCLSFSCSPLVHHSLTPCLHLSSLSTGETDLEPPAVAREEPGDDRVHGPVVCSVHGLLLDIRSGTAGGSPDGQREDCLLSVFQSPAVASTAAATTTEWRTCVLFIPACGSPRDQQQQ